MYTAGMAEAPDLDTDIAIFEARNKLGKIIEKSRYFGGITYLTNRGQRVAAVIPADVAEWIEANADAVAASIALHRDAAD